MQVTKRSEDLQRLCAREAEEIKQAVTKSSKHVTSGFPLFLQHVTTSSSLLPCVLQHVTTSSSLFHCVLHVTKSSKHVTFTLAYQTCSCLCCHLVLIHPMCCASRSGTSFPTLLGLDTRSAAMPESQARRAALMRIRLDAKDAFKARARELIGPEPDKKREADQIMKLVRIVGAHLRGRCKDATRPTTRCQRVNSGRGQRHRWVWICRRTDG